jgi:hypothetical protein
MKDRHRAPVLIIGAHRSGTSATAHALALLGLQIGQQVDSHYESKALQQLHEDYLRRVGASWFEPTPFLDRIKTPEGLRECANYLRENGERDFARIFGYRNNLKGRWLRWQLKRGAPWGWKEPRTTLFAPAWLEIFPDARIIHIIRSPMAAAMSLRERELKFQAVGDAPSGKIDNLDFGMALVRSYVEAGDRLEYRTRNYRRVRFENIQADAKNTLEELATFSGLRFDSAQLDRAAATIRPSTR